MDTTSARSILNDARCLAKRAVSGSLRLVGLSGDMVDAWELEVVKTLFYSDIGGDRNASGSGCSVGADGAGGGSKCDKADGEDLFSVLVYPSPRVFFKP
jgi:hypothetical protein